MAGEVQPGGTLRFLFGYISRESMPFLGVQGVRETLQYSNPSDPNIR
jgi:hypothetical protein